MDALDTTSSAVDSAVTDPAILSTVKPVADSQTIASKKTIVADEVSTLFVESVPIGFARRFGVLGFTTENNVMTVAVGHTDSLHALDKITALLGVATEPVWVEDAITQQAINEAYGARDSGVDTVIENLAEASVESLVDELSSSGDLLDSAAASPVTRLVNLILLEAVKRRASDVHIQPLDQLLQIRMRIDGVLYDYIQPPHSLLEKIVSRIKVMGRMNIAEKRLAQDGRTTVKVGDKTIDLRISSLPTSYGERIVLRLLDKSARLYRLPELGMSDRDMTTFSALIQRTHGLFLVTGPTGSGKSTTLYAALQQLNHKELNILTLEDPIEYQLPGISQTQVSEKKGMTFSTGLRTVLRQDPDVIMVGEIRDEETARMAIQSSLTGHLVFSTLHTNDASGAVARLLDLGVEPYLVAGSLIGVLAQRLVRCVCKQCSKPRITTRRDVDLLQLSEQRLGETVCESSGCDHCNDTGYRDRAGIFELLVSHDALQDLIVHGARSHEIKEIACSHGMRTLRDDAIDKLFQGVTTMEEVIRVTQNENSEVRD